MRPGSYSIGPLLRRAHRRAAAAFDARLAPLGIQGRHFGVLMTLERLGPQSQRQLSAHSDQDKSAMVRMIDHLESCGYVERRTDPTDRRAVAVTVTTAGHAAYLEAEQIADAVAADLLAPLDADQREELTRLLKIFNQIDPDETSPLPR